MCENIPKFLIDKLQVQYGTEVAEKIIDGYKVKRKTTLRVNSMKADVSEVCEFLEKENIEFTKVDWFENALIIENAFEKEIRELSIYEDGKVYLQSLSSMIPPIILEPKDGENILDMAAAPGGKTTEMYDISRGKANITACEKNKIRAERLKYNIEKQGATRISVLMQDARRLDDFFSFDKILLDAPCSGSGTLDAANERNAEFFTEELVNRSAKVQKELINKALKLIKKENELVYSTCSILYEENEAYLKELIDKKIIEVVPIDSAFIEMLPTLPVQIDGTLCVCPSEFYEGFYVARVKKL